MTDNRPIRSTRLSHARVVLVVTVALLTAVDLSVKSWAKRALANGASIDLQVIELRLTFNSGVAFGLGDTVPSWIVRGVIGFIIAVLAVFVWRTTPTATLPVRLGLAAVLAGAIANLADRWTDGVVTDFLHTGWFPTFNLADVLITVGAAALILAGFRTTRNTSDDSER